MTQFDPSAAQRLGRQPRAVRADRAFSWYADAMRLFRRQPLGFAAMAAAIIAAKLLLDQIPFIGRPAASIVLPLIACALLYASLAVDRGDRPRAAHFLAPFAAPVGAIAAVLLAGVVVLAAEWLVTWHLTGTNLLAVTDMQTLGPFAAVTVYVTGVAVSLPLTLVPLFALFEQASVRDAFASSLSAFFRNVPAFLLYGALSVALLGLAFITHGLGLVIVLPLWAASSYVAWKNVFGIDG